ncbi:MAG: DUF3499 family protein [Ilumatobacter sp.]|jgi:hypothetical protein|uniref:DUF3499 family protein n=1 Tax=Ilumatobacter sp. TaxID=1967498 RepID=UPI00391C4470
MRVGPSTHDHRRTSTNTSTSVFDRIASELAAAGIRSSSTDASDDDTTEIERLGDLSADASGPGGILIDGTSSWPAPDISTQMRRPILAERQCSRTGCSDAAAVTLSYHYGQSHVWIDHLYPEREPHMYDMCERHAERLSVPQGWHLDDRRGVRRGALIAV